MLGCVLVEAGQFSMLFSNFNMDTSSKEAFLHGECWWIHGCDRTRTSPAQSTRLSNEGFSSRPNFYLGLEEMFKRNNVRRKNVPLELSWRRAPTEMPFLFWLILHGYLSVCILQTAIAPCMTAASQSRARKSQPRGSSCCWNCSTGLRTSRPAIWRTPRQNGQSKTLTVRAQYWVWHFQQPIWETHSTPEANPSVR